MPAVGTKVADNGDDGSCSVNVGKSAIAGLCHSQLASGSCWMRSVVRLWRSARPWWPPPSSVRRRSGSAGHPSCRTSSPPRATCRSGVHAGRGAAAHRDSRRPTADRWSTPTPAITDSHGLVEAICHSVGRSYSSHGIARAEEQVHPRVHASSSEVHDQRPQRRQAGAARDHQDVAAVAVDLHAAVRVGQPPPVTGPGFADDRRC